MIAGRWRAEIRYEPGHVNEVLEFLKRTRSELRMLRKAYVYRDRVQVIDVNGDWFEVQAILERGRVYRDQFRPIP